MTNLIDHTETIGRDEGRDRPAVSARLALVASNAPAFVRPALPTDESLLLDLLDRCSSETQYRRFHGAVGSVTRREMHRVANPTDLHRSWVAVVGGVVRGTATLVRGRDGEAEIAILVEDGWTRRGLGRMLIDAAMDDAAAQRIDRVQAWVQADNHRAIAFLRSVVPGTKGSFADGEVLLSLPVTPWVRTWLQTGLERRDRPAGVARRAG